MSDMKSHKWFHSMRESSLPKALRKKLGVRSGIRLGEDKEWAENVGPRFEKLSEAGRAQNIPTTPLTIFMNQEQETQDEEALLEGYDENFDEFSNPQSNSDFPVEIFHEMMFSSLLEDVIEESNIDPLPGVETDTNKLKTKRKENKMSDQEWDSAKIKAIELIQSENWAPREISIEDFITEPNQPNRYQVRPKVKKYFRIFPWYHHPSARLRQSLAPESTPRGRGITIWTVIDAMNSLIRINFFENEEAALTRLQEIYEHMEIPIVSNCLTAIVEVAEMMFATGDVTVAVAEPQEEVKRVGGRGGGGGKKRTFPETDETALPVMTTSTTSTGQESPLPRGDFGPKFELEARDNDIRPLKRLRQDTCLEAVERNREMIRFYEATMKTQSGTLTSSSRQIYLDLIQDLTRANDALLTDLLVLECEEEEKEKEEKEVEQEQEQEEEEEF
jgi:hypothetical protein